MQKQDGNQGGQSGWIEGRPDKDKQLVSGLQKSKNLQAEPKEEANNEAFGSLNLRRRRRTGRSTLAQEIAGKLQGK
jgi:hypothetical protein